jgi:GT2 family glycosyltransferase
MKSCVVILNWNGADDTIACARSVLGSSASDFGVVIVDNGSNDGSARALEAWLKTLAPLSESFTAPTGARLLTAERPEQSCEYLALLLLRENGGYGAGNNAGIRLARSRGAQYTWILNNDTVVDRDALRILEARADATPQVGMVGSLVLEYDDPTRVQYLGGGRFSPFTTHNVLVKTGRARLEIGDVSGCEVDYIGGASMFCSLAALKRVGDLSEDYFLFYEELDCCERLRRASLRLAVAPSALVYHKGGVASGAKRQLQAKSATAAFYGTRSAVLFVRRFHRRALPLAVVARSAYGAALVVRHPQLGLAALRGLLAGIREPGEARDGSP